MNIGYNKAMDRVLLDQTFIAFCDLSNAISVQNVSETIRAFSGCELIQEMNGVTMPPPALQLKDKRKNFLWRIWPNRIDLVRYSPSNDGVGIDYFVQMFSKLNSPNATRVSVLSTEGITTTESFLSKTVAKALNETSLPMEFSLRFNFRKPIVELSGETANCLTYLESGLLNRRSSNGQTDVIPALIVRSDTNTIPERSEPRFGNERLTVVMNSLLELDETSRTKVFDMERMSGER